MSRLGTGFLVFFLSLNGDCVQADSETPATESPESSKRSASPPREIETGDWPEFLGPYGTGVSDETGLADSWPAEGPPVLWSKQIGVGYSAPSVLGDRLVIHHRIRDEEIIECLSAATGESAWKHSYATDFQDPYGYNGGPRCTPLLTTERCYTFGAAGTLCCTNLETGEEIWARDISKDFSIPDWFFGVGCTPILHGELLIVLVGGQPDFAVVAFDCNTGKTVWHAAGKPTWDGATMPDGNRYSWTGDEMLVSYSSPTIATFDGQPHLLCLLRQGLVSLDPASGREQFKYWFRSPVHESVNAARPVVVENRILISAAYRTGAALLEVKDKNDFSEVWRDRSNLECHWSTPIALNGHAYGFSGRHENEGTLRCLDLESGDVVWSADGSEPVRDTLEIDPSRRGYRDKNTGQPAPWPYFGRGSKIIADGHAIILGERGTLFLADLSPEGYVERSRATAPEITYPAWTAPILSRGRLYLRDEDSLVCLDISRAD